LKEKRERERERRREGEREKRVNTPLLFAVRYLHKKEVFHLPANF
jgi:hypothetical protein